MSGFIVEPSPAKVGYFTQPKSPRGERQSETININDVKAHVDKLFNDVINFLPVYASHFITFLNPDIKVGQVCLVIVGKGLLGAKSISLKEYLEGKPGICETYALDCPKKDGCEARKNYLNLITPTKPNP